MCSSLTDQVRSIATVTTAVAQGDLTRKIEIQVEGEMATLKTTVNSMVDQLSAFASEVTRVALEVGTQGILGGQARVEGAQGTWADLTLNVNVNDFLFSSQPHPLALNSVASSYVENGEQSYGSGALDLGGHQGGRVW
jgi:methyl-accepting chemotaxis protein